MRSSGILERSFTATVRAVPARTRTVGLAVALERRALRAGLSIPAMRETSRNRPRRRIH